jgi:hypothetical protein
MSSLSNPGTGRTKRPISSGDTRDRMRLNFDGKATSTDTHPRLIDELSHATKISHIIPVAAYTVGCNYLSKSSIQSIG